MPRKGYRKAAQKARTIRVVTRLTPKEFKYLSACVAARRVQSIAEYLRHLIMQREIPRRLPNPRAKLVDELARLNRKLSSIDNNLNQLAKRNNADLGISNQQLLKEISDNRAFREIATEALRRAADLR